MGRNWAFQQVDRGTPVLSTPTVAPEGPARMPQKQGRGPKQLDGPMRHVAAHVRSSPMGQLAHLGGRIPTVRGCVCVCVGVLGTGVPRSTCWKAQLRPIYIDTSRSSSTLHEHKTLAEGRPARRYKTP